MPTGINLVPNNTGSAGVGSTLGTEAKKWDNIYSTTSSIDVISSSMGSLYVSGDITASGGIKADSFQSVTGGTGIDFNDSLDIAGSITASGNISASGWITASRLTTYDDITLKDGYGGGATLVKIYDSSDDGIIDVYQNNSVKIRLDGRNGNISASGDISGSNLRGTNTGDNAINTNYTITGSQDNFVSDAQLVIVGNTSGTNTGDQNLSSYLQNSDTGSMGDIDVQGNISASGTISASGDLYARSGSFTSLVAQGGIRVGGTISGSDLTVGDDLTVEGDVDFNNLPSKDNAWLSSGTLYTQSGSQLPFATGSAGSSVRTLFNQYSSSKFVLIS